MLSSNTILAPQSKASRSCARVSTSISTKSACAVRYAAWAITWGMPPAAAMWFSLIKTASYKPTRWLVPPPQSTAYFCARRRPGRVLRVSTIWACVPWTASTYCAVLVATPLSSCKKFSAVRSAVSSARALPCTSSTTWFSAQRWPSCTCQVISAAGSKRSTAACTQALPQTTALSRASTRAWVARSAGMSEAVRSPAPTSSAKARVTSSWASWATAAGEKSKVRGIMIKGYGRYAIVLQPAWHGVLGGAYLNFSVHVDRECWCPRQIFCV